MSQGLSSTLDPRGLRILKRKLKSGEISSQVFKEVLKRQMVKQALKTPARPQSAPWGLTWLSRVGAEKPAAEAQSLESLQPGPFDMEELFTLAQLKRKRMTAR